MSRTNTSADIHSINSPFLQTNFSPLFETFFRTYLCAQHLSNFRTILNPIFSAKQFPYICDSHFLPDFSANYCTHI
jgi:hypothetical protein